MSEATLNDYELLEKLVRAKLKITPRIEKELELLAKAPAFIPKAFLQAYQHVILENNTAGVINESHSQIAYELGLTTVEPPSNISFHYPVNPGDLPDIDTDFAFPGDIKEYIKQKYGEDRVLGIPTYGRYRVKSLINDLCRVLLDDDGNPMVDPEEARALNKKLPFKIDAQIAGDIAEDEIAHEDDEEETMGMDEIFSNKDLQDFERKYPKVFEHFKLLYALPKYRGCLTGDSLVSLSNGSIKQLQNIAIGDSVINHQGNPGTVTAVMKYTIKNESLLVIKTAYSINDVKLTQDHQVYACKTKIIKNETRQSKHLDNSELKFDWIPANLLQKGDWIWIPKINRENVLENFSFDLSKYSNKISTFEQHIIEYKKNDVKHPTNATNIAKILNIPIVNVMGVLKNKIYQKAKKDLSVERVLINDYLMRFEENFSSPREIVYDRYLNLMDEEFCYWLGRFTGDGWLEKTRLNHVGFVFNSETEKDDIKNLENFLNRKNISFTNKAYDGSKAYSVIIWSEVFRNLFRELFNTYDFDSHSKHVPKLIRQLPEKYIKSFLKGYIHADGHESKNQYEMATCSENLKNDIIHLCRLINVPVSCRKKTLDFPHLNAYNCTIYKLCVPKFDKILSPSLNNKYKIFDNGIAQRITEITPLDGVKEVYDIEVDNSHSYLSSFAVHNSHAAGLVILPDAARDTLPLSFTKKTLCTEWTEGQGVSELGSVGAIKIDILGLKTLKVLDTANKLIMSRYDLSGDIPSPCVCYKQGIECITNYKMPFMIREATGERLIDFNALCLNIPKVYKAIGNYETQGVFQFEPEGISAFTHKYEPKEFYDLALITALYRPGPLDARLDKNGLPLDPEDPEFRSSLSAALNFIERRKGNLPIIYPSKKVESVLKNSYGIAVFQEVLSQMIMAMTNCSFAEAEKVRKFLTKVKPELVKTDPETIAKLASFKDKFVKQSKENGCSIKEIEAVWNLIVPFARYGFNKAHAVTYSLITYQTAFCRTLFPLEYLTSLMYHNVHNTAGKDKVIEYIRTAQKLDFVVNPPDINSSFENFTINEKGEIVGGLNMIKKVGDKAAALIIENRNEEGPFESLEDFLSRKIRWQIVKIDVLKALTHAGAFDSISPNRKLTWAKILVAKKKKIEETEEFKGIKSFETIVIGEDENGNEIKEIYLEDYSNVQKSTYARELFGFLFEDYITKNKDVINRYKDTLKIIASQKKKQVSAGTIEEIKIANQKNGQKYARITVTNLDGIKEQWLLFAHIWDVYKNDTKVFETYFAMGKKDDRTLLVDTLRPIRELLKLS